MTREEIINEIKCLLSELDNGDDAVSYLTQNDVKWLKENIKALEQEFCGDAISRQAVLDKKELVELEDGQSFYCISPEDVETLLPVQPKYNTSEWCHDCSEYDQDKHCCPRFNRVIRNAVKEVKKPKTGYISIDNVMSVFDDFMCGEVDEDGIDTFLEMLKDKAESEKP